MVLQNNTILITGGSSGLGLEVARQLTQKGNKVLICGRTEHKLRKAKKQIPEIETFRCDVSSRKECEALALWIEENHPECNMLINNAAIVHKTSFYEDEEILDKMEAEVQINLMAPVRLSKLMLPILEANAHPAIVNITTGLIYAPRALYPIYNATKAALHSFSQVLRIQMKNSPVSVIEVLYPAVDTPWHQGNPPKIAITSDEAVNEALEKIGKEKKEIKIGKVKLLYLLFRISPSLALKKINAIDS